MADTQTAAVIGTTDSQGARASIPLLNEAGFLHVSLGAGYPGFTGRFLPGEPERWFPAGGRNFARLVGDDRAQAPRARARGRRAPHRGRGRGRRGRRRAGDRDPARRGGRGGEGGLGARARRRGDLRGRGPARGRRGRRERRARDARRRASCCPTRRCATASRSGSRARRPAAPCSSRARPSRARRPRCRSSRRPSSAPTGAARAPTPRSATRRWRRCSTRSTRAAADDAAGQRRRVLREYFSGGPRETVVGPLGVLALGRGRDAALHRVPFDRR